MQPSWLAAKTNLEHLMQTSIKVLAICTIFLITEHALADIIRTEVNNGNLVMEDIPEIPASTVAALNRYQNVRSAGFLDWTEDGTGLFVSTRFGDVSQVHRVDQSGAIKQ